MTNASVALISDAPMASTYNGFPAAKTNRDLRARAVDTLMEKVVAEDRVGPDGPKGYTHQRHRPAVDRRCQALVVARLQVVGE